MAKKDARLDYLLLALCAALSVGLAVAFMFLREECMSKQDNEFVDEYCMDRLSDDRVRALASFILQVAVLLLLWALKAAVCALRTYSLESGMLEGVYVALGALAWRYQLSIFTRRGIGFFWRSTVAFFVLILLGSQAFQPLLNKAQDVQTVFVKTQNNATVFDHTSYYNVTADKQEELPISSTISSFDQLAKLAQYSGGFNSISLGTNQVSTAIVRSGFVSQRDVSGVSNARLALQHDDTVTKVDTVCTNAVPSMMPIATFAASQPQSGTAISLNFTADGINRIITGYAYDIQYSGIAQDKLIAETRTSTFKCEGCDSQYTVEILETRCTSQITLNQARFIFNVASQNVTVLSNHTGSTTVPATYFSGLIANYTRALEGLKDIDGEVGQGYKTAVLGIYGQFPTGLFNSSTANFMHTRLCSSVAYALNNLWSAYNTTIVGGFLRNGNDFRAYDVPKPLYNPVIRAYMSKTSSIAIVCCFAVPTVLFCLLGAFYTHRAKMNIKGSNENALLDNLSVADLDQRRRAISFPNSCGCCPLGVVAGGSRCARASNDDAEQRELAFNTVLLCVEDPVSKSEPAVRILNNPVGDPLPLNLVEIQRKWDYC